MITGHGYQLAWNQLIGLRKALDSNSFEAAVT